MRDALVTRFTLLLGSVPQTRGSSHGSAHRQHDETAVKTADFQRPALRPRSGLVASVALLASVALMADSARAEAPPSGVQSRFAVPHASAQLLVKPAPGTLQAEVEAVVAPFGGSVVEFASSANLYVIDIDADGLLPAAIAAVTADPRFEFAQPNYVYGELATPNDPGFAEQWAKHNTGLNGPGGVSTRGADMNMVSAWDTRTAAPGVMLAVIDDGVETSHLDLVGNLLPTGRCFASPGSARPCTNGSGDPNPADAEDFHGTLVTGAAAARGNNALGIAGTVWETNVLPIKVDLTSYAIVKAIDEAIAQGADIINMSFGGPVEDHAQSEALERTLAAGILVIAAAGNADASNDRAAHFPANSRPPNVLAVAATTAHDRIAAFSQWGSFGVELAAPGELIRTTAINNGYAAASGTSFAAPHIAGVAALVHAASSAPDFRGVKARLLHGGVDGITALGAVVPGEDKRAVPGRVAAGRIDAARALAGPTGGVLVIRSVSVDDTAAGNGNGLLDPGETATLTITLENLWIAEAAVTGTLSTPDSHLLSVNDIEPVLFGNLAENGSASAAFSVTLSNAVDRNEQIFLTLTLSSATSLTLPARHFYLEVGTLTNGSTVSQSIQRWDWDEFHAFHIDVPTGASDLRFESAGGGDIDLLVRAGNPPEYLISLGGGPFYYVDDETRVSANAGSDELVTIGTPSPGVYHVLVVNFDQTAKTYDLTATYSLPGTNQLAFSASVLTVAEAAGSVVVTVNRAGGIGPATVDYATEPGTATPAVDYTSVSGTLSWTAGESGPKTFTIPILEDTTPESLETIVVTLSNPAGASLGAPSSATVEIRDNDSSGGQTGGGAAAAGGGGGSIGVLWLLMLLGFALERRSQWRQ